MSFETLGLSPALLRALCRIRATPPRPPIQDAAIPVALAGRDLAGRRADRHRQDRRVRPAAARASASPNDHVRRLARKSRADPHPDARARRTGRTKAVRDYGKHLRVTQR